MGNQAGCHGCESLDVQEFEGFAALSRVTSDCKAWSAGGRLTICRTCGLVQTPVSTAWSAECEAIYRDYSVYHQSGGIEQAVFDPDTGEPIRRSTKLVQSLLRAFAFPEKGRLIDVGCGNGGFLKAIAPALRSWEFAGVELSDKHRDEVIGIPGVTDFYVMDPADVPGHYTAVSMIHLLEHVPNPAGLLSAMAKKLVNGGFVFAQVPTHSENPFDLLIVDHCSHFTMATLSSLFARAGLVIANPDWGWLPKELSIVAKAGRADAGRADPDAIAEEVNRVERALGWLGVVEADARTHARSGPIGVFGTSTAATWLTGAIGPESVAFYVAEDPARERGTHLGRPILTPREVDPAARVLVPLAPRVANSIRRRLGALSFELIVPDASRLSG